MSKPHLFLLEADASRAQTIEVSLRDAGYTVTTAATVDAARGLLEEVTFDVALLDLDLEDMRASELCHELRQQDPERRRGLFGVTACSNLETRVAALELG